ncbi:probable cyclic nucleotide-gated ion channel 20, chloroplastic isoform X1 [Cynara cardunculus var. scolymus]|uniref:probable cyclic nucleotide-gated ion channel 20, chloroplastic isoform X1 n=1 Tax=Cynara cardunculus var. scolymus TaxID=59895 RepID=UPI000D630856|nr:probable cyclic nucleotide-gated ion channel 20, chloroplastic isoform X1 [Cynara cardunculus var. scolymus]
MDAVEKDDMPMLTDTDWPSDRNEDNSQRRLSRRSKSVSISIPVSSFELDSSATSLVGFTGPLCCGRKTPRRQRQGNPSQSIHGTIGFERREPVEQENIIMLNHQRGDHDNEAKNEHLLRSGQLGMCNDPYCTTCPSSYNYKELLKNSRQTFGIGTELHDVLHGGATGWARKKLSLLKHFIFGVMNPHAKVVQQWNQFIVISCLLAIFIDPLFFYLLLTDKVHKCIVINWPMTQTIVVFRSMTDLIYLTHMLVQFRLAFISPESRVVGAGDLVDHPKEIALHYLSGFFFLDLFIVLPLPQMIVLFILPKAIASSGANYAKNLLRSSVLVQYLPRLYRFLPLLAGQSPSGFIFESAWANFIINLLTFVLSGHVVGSCWYLLGLQRVNQCLRDACHNSGIESCMKFLDCGHGTDFQKFEVDPNWKSWKDNGNSSACFSEGGFPYGIYVKAVNLTTENSIITRYVYSFFWGFQQISTLAGNQTPSYFVWEVLFTMGIIGLGLLLFALLIGNMQNFLQGLGRRRLEMSLRRRDVEQWMSHRRLPEDLRRKVRESERYNWAATRGVNEERLMENLPEDVQRDIRRHLFEFVKKVRIFALMDEPILDAICERLRQKTYIKGGKTLYQGGLVTKMVFIVRGKMESMGEDGNKVPLSEGDVCGEELLRWCLEDSSVNGDARNHTQPRYRLRSNRTVKCLTNVEAFVLRAADLEEVTSLFAGFLRNHRVQIAIRNESPYWRGLAATTIQVAWRYRKKRLSHTHTSRGGILFRPSWISR